MGDLPPGRRLAYWLVLTLTGGTLALAAGELAVRIFVPQWDVERWFESHPRYAHVLKPNFRQTFRYPGGFSYEVRTNSLGLRSDREFELARDDVKRVLLLGDSFTFGEGLPVEHTFASQLDALLNGDGPRRYDVLNAGVGGWGTLQEVTYALDHLPRLRPHAIVLTFCGNDPDDDARFLAKDVDNEKGRFYFPGKIFIRNHSQLYGLAYRTQFRIRHERRMRRKLAAHPELAAQRDPQSSTLISEDQWAVTLDHIRRLLRGYRAFDAGGRLLVQATYPMNEGIRAHLPSLTDGEGCVYVDLYEGARALGPDKLRLPYDGHWTQEMHTLSARALHAQLLPPEGTGQAPRAGEKN
ncbi:MAG TPA: SGNH/GDSL hydrolase family protein [Vicinamibacteria bacterium]|nr:SGNH/GDSL hydrolase family protein [Vicinamibacteria bacterium]